jgi:hypothetical protein
MDKGLEGEVSTLAQVAIIVGVYLAFGWVGVVAMMVLPALLLFAYFFVTRA